MKGNLLGFVLILLLITQITFAQCEYSADINLDVIAKDNDTISKYQFPDYKEDTIISINKLTVTNTGNCTLPVSYLKIRILKPDNSESENFCMVYKGIRIPELEINTYEIELVHLCSMRLDKIGKWSISSYWELPPENISQYGFNFRVEDSFLNQFNVLSRFDIKNLETSLNNLETAQSNLAISLNTLFWNQISLIITAIIGLIAILISGISLYYSSLKGSDIKMFFDEDSIIKHHNLKTIEFPVILYNDGIRTGMVKSITLKSYSVIPENNKISVDSEPVKYIHTNEGEKDFHHPQLIKDGEYLSPIIRLSIKSPEYKSLLLNKAISEMNFLIIELEYLSTKRCLLDIIKLLFRRPFVEKYVKKTVRFKIDISSIASKNKEYYEKIKVMYENSFEWKEMNT